MKDIILIGGGGHCRSVIDVIEAEKKFEIAGIVDKLELYGSSVFDYKVIGNDNDLPSLVRRYKYACITVGQVHSPTIRRNLFKLLKDIGFILPSIISPRAHVSKHSLLGEGSIVMHDALVNANVHIGKNCIINTKALIEHDSIIKDNCHISTGAVVNGDVKIASDCFIGSNAIIKESTIIKSESFIKAGSLVK